MTNVILENLLYPLKIFLEQNDVTELSINRAGELWLEKKGEMICHALPQLTLRYLKDLAKLIATYTEQKISEEYPLLAGFLPQGYRIQIVYPPAVSDNTVGISIRKPSLVQQNIDWHDILSSLQNSQKTNQDKISREKMQRLYDEKNYQAFLALVVEQRCNILISGGTSTGKTTFLNSLLRWIPQHERIITIEDVPEIQLTQPNSLALFASRGQQRRSKIDMQDLVEASLRLRPDRIIIGELRGAEAFSFLRAINTGHPGSFATLHADTPQLAFEQLILMVMQKNIGLTRKQIEQYIHSIIDVVIQLKKGTDGSRFISEIYYDRKLG